MPKYFAHMRKDSEAHNCWHVLTFEHLLKKRELAASFPLLGIRGMNRKYICNGGMMSCEHTWYYFCCDVLIYDTIIIRRNLLSSSSEKS
jgi:hypothetical protein